MRRKEVEKTLSNTLTVSHLKSLSIGQALLINEQAVDSEQTPSTTAALGCMIRLTVAV